MVRPWPTTSPTRDERASFADAETRSYWLEDLPERSSHAPLQGIADADLCIVGGGYTGLWAALHAKTQDPDRSVVLLEADLVGAGAPGRNGGFLVASLTHGLSNGLARFPREFDALQRLGVENYEGFKRDLRTFEIDAELEEAGELLVFLEDHEVNAASATLQLLRAHGEEAELLDREAVRAQLNSPTYLGGLWQRNHAALVHPARLVLGLHDAAVGLGVQIYEHSPAGSMSRQGPSVVVGTSGGAVKARRVLLATSAYPPLLRRLRSFVLPVYDYQLATEPLSADRKSAIGWSRRQGVADRGNQFHYYRLTADDRIIFGGYDAVYHRGSPVGAHLDDRPETFGRLAQHFFATFPQLRGTRFTHRWGAPSTLVRAARCSSVRPWRVKCLTHSATRGWAWEPPGSAPEWRSTFLTGAVPKPRSSTTYDASRCPSRRARTQRCGLAHPACDGPRRYTGGSAWTVAPGARSPWPGVWKLGHVGREPGRDPPAEGMVRSRHSTGRRPET